MAQNKIEILIIADGKKAHATLVTTGKDVKELGGATKQADTQTTGFGKSMLSLQSAISALGLGALVSQTINFAKEAYNAAASAERLGGATQNLAAAIGETGDSMVRAITAASQGTISQVDAMSAANKAMMFGLVENSDQMARLTEVAITLGAAMGQDASKSIDDLTTALGRQSPMILDNLGITLKLEEAYKIYAAQLGKTAEQLTEEEKKQAFVNAALIKGEERVKELGGVTLDTAAKSEQLSAAWADFTVEFGKLLNLLSGGVSTLTSFVRELERGAQAWQGIFSDLSAIQAYNDAQAKSLELTEEQVAIFEQAAGAYVDVSRFAQEATESTEDLGQSQQALSADSDRLSGLAEQYAKRLEDTNRVQEEAKDLLFDYGATIQGVVVDEEALIEAEKRRQEQTLSLASTTADYFLSYRELQASQLADEASFNEQMAGLHSDSAARITELESGLADELAKIEEDKQAKIAWVRTGAWERTQAEEAEAEAFHAQHYDTLRDQAIAKTQEKVDAIKAKEAEAAAAQRAAREAERAEYQQHLEELKLQTALSVLETTGQLEQLTGLVGLSAGDAADLISAGLLPVTEDLGLALQGTLANMETGMADAAATSEENQAIIQEALAGTLTGTQNLSNEYGVNLPAQIGLADTTSAAFVENATLGVTTLHEEAIIPFEEELNIIANETVPNLEASYVTSFANMLAATERLIARLPALVSMLNQGKAAAVAMADAMVSGFDKAAGKVDKLTKAIDKAAEAMEKLQSIAARTVDTISGLSGQQSGITGVTFQHGTPSGGYLVPKSFGVDQFMALFSGGERIFAYPNDRVPAGGGDKIINYHFNQTVNTRADSSTVIGDFRTMQMLLGA